MNSPNLPPEESGPEGTEPPPEEVLAGGGWDGTGWIWDATPLPEK